MAGKCPHCSAPTTLEGIRAANGRCPSCGAAVKVRFTGAPRPVNRPSVRTTGEGLRNSLENIGPYEILAEISRGGMGIVYKARDKSLKKTVAIKVLLRGSESSSDELKRFRREAEAAAKLQHSNIVPIHAVGVCQGLHYFVMDFIEGEPLSELAARGGVSPRQALDYLEQLADALAYAHAAGVVHRDIKPANVMIDRHGRPQLMDFGLAKDVTADTQLTQVGTTMGTPTYMPPEQAEGDLAGIDAQSDVYSLGAVLYELLTGKAPFEGATTMAILMKVLEEEPERPRDLNPRIHPDVEAICLKAMAKDKRDRYRSAAELRDDIRRFKAGEMIEAARGSAMRQAVRLIRRHAQIFVVLVVAVLAVGALAGWNAWRAAEEREQQREALRQKVGQLLSKADGLAASGGSADQAQAEDLYRQVQSLAPGEARASQGLKALTEARRRQQIGFLMSKGQAYLDSGSFAAAQDMFEEALKILGESEPEAARARAGLRRAMGTGTITVHSQPEKARIYIADGRDFAEPEPAERIVPGRLLGETLPAGKEEKIDIPMGLHRITLVKDGYGWQSIPVNVKRGQDVPPITVELFSARLADGDLRRVSNVVRVPAGPVNIEGAESQVEAFLVDRYEYPNLLGAAPRRALGFAEAQEFAAAAGKRLPTRAEWMLAAGGKKGLNFPYGDIFRPDYAVTGRAYDDGPLPCGSRPQDRSFCGAYDMSGNVSEWVADSPRAERPAYGEEEEPVHEACGGNWTSIQPESASVQWVVSYSLIEQPEMVGFRCAMSVGRGATLPPSGPGPSTPAKGPAKPDGDVFLKQCPPDMVVIRPVPGTPAHDLVPYAFCIDRYEYPNKAGGLPKGGFSWAEAEALARKLGRRLPTANEWRVACGGAELWDYGYGSEYRPGSLRVELAPDAGPARSGETPDARSPFGVFDLNGNLSEWLADRIVDQPGKRWVAGGCWVSNAADARASSRMAYDPEAKSGTHGFRCAARLAEEPRPESPPAK